MMMKVGDNKTQSSSSRVDATTTTTRIVRPWARRRFLLLLGGGCTTANAWTTTTTLPRSTHAARHRRRHGSSSAAPTQWYLFPPLPNDNAATTTTTSTLYRYDGTTEEGWIAHANYFIQQTDCGLLDPSILLDDNDEDNNQSPSSSSQRRRFQCIDAPLQVPLSKIEYIAAGRYFNVRHAFPDFNLRPYDFRIVRNNNNNKNMVTIRATCRGTGTMRGELRLRNQVILAPTGITMTSPPEAITMSFDRATGQMVQLCTGFVLDRQVGNTRGTTGVVAASVIAGEEWSVWDSLPPMTILQNVFARPVPPVRESTLTESPFPESVMIQLAKGILSSQMAYNDPTLLSDASFSYTTPIVGPITKNHFLKSYALQEFPAPLQPVFTNFRVDPYDPLRVWVDVVLTVPTENFTSPPQAMSFRFDDQGYCTRITSQAVMDPSASPTAGGLGGYDGYQYHLGQGRPGIYTRPITRSWERWQCRCLAPLTGMNVDDYQLPAPRRNLFEQLFSTTTTTTRKTPQPPSTPPAVVVVESNEVVKRLESLKEFTSSIRIIPPSLSNPDSTTTGSSTTVQERLTQATKATQQSKLKIEQSKREAAALQQKIARAEANAAQQKKQQDVLRAQQQKLQSATQQKTAAEVARLAATRQKEQLVLEQRRKQEEKARQQQRAAARQKEQLALEQRRKQEETERQKRAAAAEAEVRQRELEAQRIAQAATQEAKKVALMKEQLAAAEARTRPTKSKVPVQQSPSIPIPRTASPSRSVNNERDAARTPSFNGLARATISLFGLGKSELEELPAPTVKSLLSSPSKSRRAPLGVPTVTRWRKNSDQTITGLVQGSRNFDNGSRITTSPITSGTIAPGEVVRTGSGSRYFLE